MQYLKNFLLFWYEFIVGDDWLIAAGVVAALALSLLFVRQELNAWWVVPVAVIMLLVVSLWRGTRPPRDSIR